MVTLPCKEIALCPSFTTRHVEMEIVTKSYIYRGFCFKRNGPQQFWMNIRSTIPKSEKEIYQLHSCKMKSTEQSKANLWVAVMSYLFQELLPNCPASCEVGDCANPLSLRAFQLVVPLWTPLDAAWGSPGLASLGPTSQMLLKTVKGPCDGSKKLNTK